MSNTYNAVKSHAELCKYLNDMYAKKNSDYGNSFSDSYRKFGIISALTRISDKYNRIVNLCTNAQSQNIKDESAVDTLLDMANYCIMTVMELDNKNSSDSKIIQNDQSNNNASNKSDECNWDWSSPWSRPFNYNYVLSNSNHENNSNKAKIVKLSNCKNINTDDNMARSATSAQDSSDDENHGD